MPRPGFYQVPNFPGFVLLINSTSPVSRARALPGPAATKLHLLFRNLLCGQTRQARASCSSTPNHPSLNPPKYLHSLFLTPSWRLPGAPHPHHSSAATVSQPRIPLSTVRAVGKFFVFLRKSIVFHKPDLARGPKRCWFFPSLTKRHRRFGQIHTFGTEHRDWRHRSSRCGEMADPRDKSPVNPGSVPLSTQPAPTRHPVNRLLSGCTRLQ